MMKLSTKFEVEMTIRCVFLALAIAAEMLRDLVTLTLTF